MDDNQRKPGPPNAAIAFFGWGFIACGVSIVIEQMITGETGIVTNLTPLAAWVIGGAVGLVGLRFVMYYYRAKRRARS